MLNLLHSDPRFNLRWDHRDMIRNIDLGGGGQAYYQYDAGKQRSRKRIDGEVTNPMVQRVGLSAGNAFTWEAMSYIGVTKATAQPWSKKSNRIISSQASNACF